MYSLLYKELSHNRYDTTSYFIILRHIGEAFILKARNSKLSSERYQTLQDAISNLQATYSKCKDPLHQASLSYDLALAHVEAHNVWIYLFLLIY